MSIRVDTASWIPGAIVIGHRGLGVLADDIPSEGDSGGSYLFNDLTLPADSGKEICGRITSWPSAGALYAYEDGAFEFTDAPDGSYSFIYSLYVDGVASGSGTVVLQVGSATAAISATTDATTFSGAASSGATASIGATSGDATFSGQSTCGAAVRVAAVTANATFSGSAALSGVTSASISAVTDAAAFSGSACSSPQARIVATTAATTFSGLAIVSGTQVWNKRVLANSLLTMECVIKSPIKTNVYSVSPLS